MDAPLCQRDLEVYLGLHTEARISDERFKNNVHALYDLTEDYIFFSINFSYELHTYEKSLYARPRQS